MSRTTLAVALLAMMGGGRAAGHSPLLRRAQRSEDPKPGEWTDSPLEYRCHSCSELQSLDGMDFGVSADGHVTPAFTCPSCTTTVLLKLDGWCS